MLFLLEGKCDLLFYYSLAYLELSQTSRMERSAKIVTMYNAPSIFDKVLNMPLYSNLSTFKYFVQKKLISKKKAKIRRNAFMVSGVHSK